MKIPTESIDELQDVVETALTECNSARFDEIQTRKCHSDEFDTGIEVTISGERIAIVPIVEAVKSLDDWNIETITASEHAVQHFEDGDFVESSSGAEIYFPYQAEEDSALFIR